MLCEKQQKPTIGKSTSSIAKQSMNICLNMPNLSSSISRPKRSFHPQGSPIFTASSSFTNTEACGWMQTPSSLEICPGYKGSIGKMVFTTNYQMSQKWSCSLLTRDTEATRLLSTIKPPNKMLCYSLAWRFGLLLPNQKLSSLKMFWRGMWGFTGAEAWITIRNSIK